jgi:CRISPR-associated protein Csy2
MTRRLLILPHLKIHNANALSSPFTIGFPALTAWLGFVHALQRKLNTTHPSLEFIATGVFSHQCDLQTYKGPGDFVSSIIGTANPLNKKGERSSFIEEARCHLDVSLLIEYKADEETEDLTLTTQFISDLCGYLVRMKVAGGDLQSFKSPQVKVLAEDDEFGKRKLMRSLMPSFALIERRELMQQSMERGEDVITAMLDYLTIHHKCDKDDDGNVTWTSHRKTDDQGQKLGWVVPISTGFHGISDLGEAKNQRDPTTPHRFAESVVTLGEFRMAHKIKHLDEVLWYYHTDIKNNLYLCQQSHKPETSSRDGFE